VSFTTLEFPNKVFETIAEYDTYVELRKKIIERLKKHKERTRTRVVKVVNSIKKNDPIIQLLLWILQSQKT